MDFINNMLTQTFGDNAGEETKKQIETQKELDSIHKNKQLANVNQNAPFFVEKLEHAVGLSTMLDFVNHYISKGTPLNVKDDIIYFDSQLSSKVLMGCVKPLTDINGNVTTHNPFLCSYYDFIANTRWKTAYVYKNRIYLIADRVALNSYSCKQIPAFALSIMVDDISKFKRWNNQNSLDIRKIKFQLERQSMFVNKDGQQLNPEELENLDPDNIPEDILNKWATAEEKITNIPIQSISETEVEQTIPLLFLTENNKHLIYSANEKKLKYEEEKLNSMRDLSPEIRARNTMMQNAQLFNYYHIDTLNQNQRDYGKEEVKFAKEHGIDEKEFEWNKYRDATMEDN